MLLALVVATGAVACQRDHDGPLPTVSGEAIKAQRAAVQGFGLVAAHPDQPVYVNRLVLVGKPNEQQVAGQQRRTEARRDPLHQLRRVEIRVTV